MRLMEFFGMTEAGVEQDPTRDSGMFDPFERPRGAGYYRMAVPDEVRARWSEVRAAFDELDGYVDAYTQGRAELGGEAMGDSPPAFAEGTMRTEFKDIGVRPFPELLFGNNSVWVIPAADLRRINSSSPGEAPPNERTIRGPGGVMLLVYAR